MATRYDCMTIARLRTICERLEAAYANPRTANRANVGAWMIDAKYALLVALGEV